jgi:hypothetical protein
LRGKLSAEILHPSSGANAQFDRDQKLFSDCKDQMGHPPEPEDFMTLIKGILALAPVFAAESSRAQAASVRPTSSGSGTRLGQMTEM